MQSRRGISSLLLMVVALIPLAFIIDFTLFYVSYPNAAEYVGIIDFPIVVAIIGALFFARRRRRASATEKVAVPQTTPMDRLKERNGGRRAPVSSAESILDQDEEEEADVFAGTPDVGKRARDVDEILQRMKAREMYLGAGPDREVEARPQPIILEPEPPPAKQPTEPEVGPKGKIKNYVLSPEKLKVPAFICRCGHAHRFVCLTCGLTVDAAAKKSKTHWVEWSLEMGAQP